MRCAFNFCNAHTIDTDKDSDKDFKFIYTLRLYKCKF